MAKKVIAKSKAAKKTKTKKAEKGFSPEWHARNKVLQLIERASAVDALMIVGRHIEVGLMVDGSGFTLGLYAPGETESGFMAENKMLYPALYDAVVAWREAAK